MDDATIERFWNKVNKSGPVSPLAPELGNCWVWTSGTDKHGCGKFWTADADYRASRFSWLLANGAPVPAYIVQVCGNSLCVNPGHLSNRAKDRRKVIKHSDSTQVPCHCLNCGAEFRVKASIAKRGHGKFCKRDCWKAWDARISSDPRLASRRFWSRVNKNGPTPAHVPKLGNCWQWEHKRTEAGYGVFWFRRRNCAAHRFSYELANSASPGELHVCHRCDNPSCVRPDHLFLGTLQDNMADRNAKGRQARGEKIASSLLTESVVRRIVELRGQGLTQPQIAERIGFSNQTVSSILTGNGWKHVAR